MHLPFLLALGLALAIPSTSQATHRLVHSSCADQVVSKSLFEAPLQKYVYVGVNDPQFTDEGHSLLQQIQDSLKWLKDRLAYPPFKSEYDYWATRFAGLNEYLSLQAVGPKSHLLIKPSEWSERVHATARLSPSLVNAVRELYKKISLQRSLLDRLPIETTLVLRSCFEELGEWILTQKGHPIDWKQIRQGSGRLSASLRLVEAWQDSVNHPPIQQDRHVARLNELASAYQSVVTQSPQHQKQPRLDTDSGQPETLRQLVRRAVGLASRHQYLSSIRALNPLEEREKRLLGPLARSAVSYLQKRDAAMGPMGVLVYSSAEENFGEASIHLAASAKEIRLHQALLVDSVQHYDETIQREKKSLTLLPAVLQNAIHSALLDLDETHPGQSCSPRSLRLVGVWAELLKATDDPTLSEELIKWTQRETLIAIYRRESTNKEPGRSSMPHDEFDAAIGYLIGEK